MVSLNPLNWFRKETNSNVTAVDELDPFAYSGQTAFSPWESSIYDGGKFFGGFGPTQIQLTDYWTLRARSAQLFNENLYARGLIRRLVTNEINTGLTPEAAPDEQIIGVAEDSLNDWTETVENRFGIWSKSPELCDWKATSTFGAIQRAARAEALISGDVLVVLRQSQRTKLPMVQLVSGSKVQTPLGGEVNIRKGHVIRHGVEFDTVGRETAHWIKQDDGSSKRIPAFGEKSGRRISWLVYGSDKRLDDVRGQPLLSLVLQSLKEIDRYRDSAQRKAVINSVLAMFIEKTEDKAGTLPVTGGAVRRDKATTTDSDGKKRSFNIANQIPGLVMEELQTGEKPVGFHSQGTDVNFGTFEEAIIQAVAWANEIPPEILRLAFSNNYSASQAAINEFKIYLNKVWSDWGETFCTPVYVEWLLSETLLQKIRAPGLLDSWRDPRKYDIFGAWVSTDWYGSIKPSTDMLKQAKGSKMLVDEGWSTNAREARITTGTKFSKNIKRLKRENELKVEAARPLAEFRAEFGDQVAEETIGALDGPEELEAMLDEYLEEKGLVNAG
ncbi:portal protein [Shewanella phage SppYZU01]|nr:portal protein [Shewanella phage SppYZU01]